MKLKGSGMGGGGGKLVEEEKQGGISGPQWRECAILLGRVFFRDCCPRRTALFGMEEDGVFFFLTGSPTLTSFNCLDPQDQT